MSQEKKPYPTIHTLISKNKRKFIISSKLSDQRTIISPYIISNKIAEPSLIVGMNRMSRAKALFMSASNVFIMHCDGRQIEIDGVNKLLQFEKPNCKGIAIYHLKNDDSLEYEIDAIYEQFPTPYKHYIVVNKHDEITDEHKPYYLRVHAVPLYGGFIATFADKIEKIFHCSITNINHGVLGMTDYSYYEHIRYIQLLWPELNIKSEMRDNGLLIWSETIRDSMTFDNCNFVVQIHRNYNSTELNARITHRDIFK